MCSARYIYIYLYYIYIEKSLPAVRLGWLAPARQLNVWRCWKRLETGWITFAPEGAAPLKPVDLMNKLFQLADAHLASEATPLPTSSTASPAAAVQNFLPSAGRDCMEYCVDMFVHVHEYIRLRVLLQGTR